MIYKNSIFECQDNELINILPLTANNNILIICEGYEEKVWSNYNIDLINAESNGSIFPHLSV